MAIKSQVSELTLVGDDQARAFVDTITLSQTAKRVVGVWAYVAGGSSTSAVSGYFDLESPDVDLKPMQLPLDVATVLTSGAVAFSPRIFPVDIPVSGKVDISGYVTLDSALPSAMKARFGLIYET